MDVAANRSQPEKPRLETMKDNSRLFAVGLPLSLEEAALLLYALSFGPLPKNDLTRALKQAGLTMPDGSTVTPERVAPCIQRLRAKGRIKSVGSSSACPPETRMTYIAAARETGWFSRLAQDLQKAVPGQVNPGDWAYKWGGRRFASFSHACRDVFLALERDDQDELKRLAGLCSLDVQVGSLVNVLLEICMEPFQPAYLERLPRQYRDLLLYAALNLQTCALALDHPVFAYARAWILANRQDLEKSLLEKCVNHLVERDILAGDFNGAKALLDTFTDLDTYVVRGMLELLSGRVPEAHQAYDLALQEAGKAKKAQLEYLGSFPAMLHALLLVQSEQPQDRQRARTWLDWLSKDRDYAAYHEAYCFLEALLAWHEGCDADDGANPVLRPFYGGSSPLGQVAVYLMQLLYWIYASHTKALKTHKQMMVPEIAKLLGHCEKHGARWPVMQISHLAGRLGVALPAYAPQVDAFFQETGTVDLAGLWTVKEVWESRLGALEQLIQEAEHTAHQASGPSRRLVWKLREWDSGQIGVVPIEQKRTKAGGWTKGREITSYQMSDYPEEAMDFMTDQDRAALAGVLMRRDYYYGEGYRTDPGLILRALVGHPHVFWEDRPHVPVEIVEGRPEVHIVPKAGQLHICMDPYPDYDPDDDLNPSCIIKESQARVRVIIFEPMHLKMAEVLGPDGVMIPKGRSEDALKRLQGLSRHVAIQSDVVLAAAEAETVESNCHPHLRLQRLEQGLNAEMVIVPLGGQTQRAFAPGIGNAHLVETIEGKTIQTRRKLEEETARAEQALEAVSMLRECQRGLRLGRG